ncbi:Predicted cobalt transporter CbtA [Devosia sp. DBB001]|nr:Predicted cobalt transporter CbtA [Devosia sp. DBB001]
MNLFRRIFFAAVLAGLAAGLAMSAVQQWRVAPLILEAETYEGQEAPAVHDHADATAATPAAAHEHEHDEDAWAPQDGAERILYTVLADVLAAIGFALVLAAVSVLVGLPVTAANGIVWGLGGFIVFQLAPAFGLPPELPGMPAADLGARQLWWWGTVIATGAGLLGIAKFRNWQAIAVGAVLILLPHLIGAPQPPHEPSAVPAHLATAFAASALSAGAVFWFIVGPLLGYLNTRFAKAEASQTRMVHA